MASTADTDILERHRARLEESLTKLRKALQVWHERSAEYEGLQEELRTLPATASRNDMLAIAKDFGGTVISSADINSLLGTDPKVTRSLATVCIHIQRRIDEYQKNVTDVQKLIDKGEGDLAVVDVISKPDQVTNEEGLPLMEIREEVDEAGNEIRKEGEVAKATVVPMSLEGLKAFQPFVNELEKKEQGGKTEVKTADEKPFAATETVPSAVTKASTPTAKVPTKPAAVKHTSAFTKPITPKSTGAPLNVQNPTAGLAPGEGIASIQISKELPKHNDAEADDSSLDEEFHSAPSTEIEEDEDAAALRRDMIRYNLNEIGAVVAEIDLEEEDESYGSDDEEVAVYSDNDEDEVVEVVDDDEDDYGRSKKRGVSTKIQREMQALQYKLQAREDARKRAEVESANRKEVVEIKPTTEIQPSPPVLSDETRGKKKEKTKVKKGVRFNPELDISPAPAPLPPKVDDEEGGEVDPSILDMVFGPGTKDSEDKKWRENVVEQPMEKGPSLFKSARMAGKEELAEVKETPAPAGIMSDAVMERVPLGAITSGVSSPQAPQPPKKMSRFAASRAAASAASFETSPPVNGRSISKPSAQPPQLRTSHAKSKAPTTSSLQSRPLQPLPYADPESLSSSSFTSPSTLQDTIIERDPLSNPALPPSDLDPDLHRQEIAMQYHLKKNQFIQRQGGYASMETDEEKSVVSLNEDGEKVKISRFKANLARNVNPY